MIWQIDAIEYLYPISYLGMLLFLLFFPVFFDLLKCVTKGKKILIFLSVFTTVSVDLVTIISMICHAIECRIFKDMLVFSCMTFVKIILLVFIYRLLIHTEKMQMERYSFGYLSIIKFVLPLIIVLLFAFSKISIKNSGVFILRNAEIDGYWFIGSIEAFIENYENPYQDKRYYLDYKLVEEKKSEEIKEGYEWYFDEEQNCQFIKTFGRKLEGIYYLNEFTLEESETSNLHKYELSKRFAGCREDVKDYRAVLSSEEYEHTVFYYRITSNMEYQPIYIYDSDGKNVPRAIETYDILIDTKEIPAYFLGMVDCYGIVKVESYVHYWGENPFQIGINIYRKLQTVRQY